MKKIYLILFNVLLISLLSCQKNDVADYQILFSADNGFHELVDSESPKSLEVYDYIQNELIGEYRRKYPDMSMTVSVRVPGSADVEAIHKFDSASEELRRIEKIANDMVKLALSEDTDNGNFSISYRLTLERSFTEQGHKVNSTLREAHFLVEYKGGDCK